ncbi:MAG TPA: hypothetical protein VJ010_09140, partial [Actinomycetota bacterium]|nr:hypothetical protein [Actinomycetota bacterium]
MDRKLRDEIRETQKRVKEAALSVQKAADKAAKIGKATKEEIRRSKEVKEVRVKAGEALKAIGAAAKVAHKPLDIEKFAQVTIGYSPARIKNI